MYQLAVSPSSHKQQRTPSSPQTVRTILAPASRPIADIPDPRVGHHLTLEDDILPNLQLGSDIHTAPTRLISLENTLAGQIFPQEEIIKISEEAGKHGIIMHLDGARIWEVAAVYVREKGLSVDDEGLGVA